MINPLLHHIIANNNTVFFWNYVKPTLERWYLDARHDEWFESGVQLRVIQWADNGKALSQGLECYAN